MFKWPMCSEEWLNSANPNNIKRGVLITEVKDYADFLPLDGKHDLKLLWKINLNKQLFIRNTSLVIGGTKIYI